MWYDCQWVNSPQVTKMIQKLTTIGHNTAFNNEQSPYRIVSYKRPRNDNVNQFKLENYRPNLCPFVLIFVLLKKNMIKDTHCHIITVVESKSITRIPSISICLSIRINYICISVKECDKDLFNSLLLNMRL